MKTQTALGQGRHLLYRTMDGDLFPAIITKLEGDPVSLGHILLTLTVLSDLGPRVVTSSSQGDDGDPKHGQWAWPFKQPNQHQRTATVLNVKEVVEQMRPLVREIVLDLISQIDDVAGDDGSEKDLQKEPS